MEDARALLTSFTRSAASSRALRIGGVTVLAAASLLMLTSVRFDASAFVQRDIGEGASHPRYRFTRPEKCFMRKINNKRERRGLRRLRWDRQIGYVARRHARRMGRASGVWHDPALGEHVTRWRVLGQNTGSGRSCRSLFHRFWKSSAHRGNILGRWRYVGVGTKRRDGMLFVQQVFEFRTNPGNTFGYP